MKFIDEVDISVASGSGGAGCVSFRRESRVPRGGPDGGSGGSGGNIVFKTNPQLQSLLDLRYKKQYRAARGGTGGSSLKTGHKGADLVIAVPPGTQIYKEGQLIRDMAKEKEYVFLKGGCGGKGNTFYKSSVNQIPQIAQRGKMGQQADVHLELKLLADVGLVGLPNAGKSTLISRISAARPKIANYPFTTRTPHLGVVYYGSLKSYVVADIPGLIAGAHKGVGLGIQFLKHIDRTKVLVHVIDGCEMSNPLEAYRTLNRELEAYDSNLVKRPQIVVINKLDTMSLQRRQDVRHQLAPYTDVHFISAATRKNVEKMVYLIGEKVFGVHRE